MKVYSFISRAGTSLTDVVGSLPESQPRPVLPTGQDKCTLQQAAVLLGFAPLVPKAQLSFS